MSRLTRSPGSKRFLSFRFPASISESAETKENQEKSTEKMGSLQIAFIIFTLHKIHALHACVIVHYLLWLVIVEVAGHTDCMPNVIVVMSGRLQLTATQVAGPG